MFSINIPENGCLAFLRFLRYIFASFIVFNVIPIIGVLIEAIIFFVLYTSNMSSLEEVKSGLFFRSNILMFAFPLPFLSIPTGIDKLNVIYFEGFSFEGLIIIGFSLLRGSDGFFALFVEKTGNKVPFLSA